MRLADVTVAALAAMVAGTALPVAEAMEQTPALGHITNNASITVDGAQITCAVPNWHSASCFYLRSGVSYLHKLGDHPCHSQPHTATRVSCEYGAGIFFENFGDQPLDIPCGTVGDWAQDIINQCGGSVCNNDNRKPGTCINGAKECEQWSVFIVLQDC